MGVGDKRIPNSRIEATEPVTIMRNISAIHHPLAMLAGIQLDIFTFLRDGPMEARTLASTLGVLENKLTPLLYSLVAAGLLNIENKSFVNTPEADNFLVRGRPTYMGEVCGFYNRGLHAMLNTAESIRSGKPQCRVEWCASQAEELLKFFQHQYYFSVFAGREIVNRIDFSEFQRLLDAGGGTGATSICICNKFNLIRATIVDLPAVTQIAERFIGEAGMADRISVLPTDLCSAAPEGQYDAAILCNFLHVLSREQAQLSLKHIGQSIVHGGRIFVIGSALENTELAPVMSLIKMAIQLAQNRLRARTLYMHSTSD